MNENIKKLILDKIEEYETIIVSRHIRPDGDAIGSTKGLVKILRDTYPDKKFICTTRTIPTTSLFWAERTSSTGKTSTERCR